jgi:hypothetical protein
VSDANYGHRSIISLGTSKEAALYFDRVFPNDILISALSQVEHIKTVKNVTIPFDHRESTKKIINSLVGDNPDFVEKVITYNRLVAHDIVIQLNGIDIDGWEKLDISHIEKEIIEKFGIDSKGLNDQKRVSRALSQERAKIIKRLGFSDSLVWTNEDIFDHIVSNEKKQSNDFLITLQGLNLIDIQKISWDAVCELRRDADSMRALRNLRLFFYENLSGKDKNFIEDRLLQLEDEYAKTVKIWGFDTAAKALSIAFDSKGMLASAAPALALGLAGAPIAVAAASALVVPIGRTSIKICETIAEATRSKAANPVKYLTHLRDLEKKSKV